MMNRMLFYTIAAKSIRKIYHGKYPEYCSDFPNLICGLNDDARLVLSKAIPDFCFDILP